MIFEGDRGVIAAIQEKKQLMEAGESHDHIRPVLFIDGGLMKGSYGVGACLALEELGYTRVFDNVVGVSSGAPSAAYFISGDTSAGSSLLWEECCSRAFMNTWRFWNQVDTDYLISAIKQPGPKGLSVDTVLSARSKLYIGVADFTDGTPKLFQPTSAMDLYASIQASILMPNVSNDIVHIDDIRYVDGGFTRPHMLQLALDEIKATHYLIITNQDHINTLVPPLPLVERFLNHTVFRWRMPKALRFAAHERWKERMKVVQHMRDTKCVPAALVWGDRSIRSMERDPKKVRHVVERSREWWHKLLQDTK